MARRTKQNEVVQETIGWMNDTLCQLLTENGVSEETMLALNTETPDGDVITDIGEDLDDEVFNAIVEAVDEWQPPKKVDRSAARKALRAQRTDDGSRKEQKKAYVNRAAKLVKEQNAVIINNVEQLLSAMAENKTALIFKPINKREIALIPVSAMEFNAPKRSKKGNIEQQRVIKLLKNDDYQEYLDKMKTEYPDTPDKIKYAESLGLVDGTDFHTITKDGRNKQPSMIWIDLSPAIRKALGGIPKYVVSNQAVAAQLIINGKTTVEELHQKYSDGGVEAADAFVATL